VATIVAARGNRGEVAAICPGGPPERMAGVAAVLLEDQAGGIAPRGLVRQWPHRGRWILHFEGVDSIAAAESLVGRRVFLAEEDLPELPPDHHYTFRLAGARVVDGAGRLLGRVRDTQTGPAHDLLVVERPDGSEALVPMIRAIVRRIDEAAGEVEVDAPEGLLEGEPEVVR
jgi:16S rRNA processing protein RimM